MSANGGGDGEPFRVVSTNRPLPRQARDDLNEFGIVGELTAEEVENPPLGVSPQTVVGLLVEERPTDDALDRSELKVIEDPIEVWEGRGAEVRIFPTKVVSSDDGEMNLDPEEAAEFVRQQEDFSPVDVPDDSPFGPTPDDLLTPEEGREQALAFLNEHSSVGRWQSVPESEWDDERSRFTGEAVAEWASPDTRDGRIYVTVSMDPNDGEDDDADEPPTFDVNATAVGDLNHDGGPAVGGVLEDDIDSVLEGTLSWLQNRPAVTEYPTFTAQVKKGVIAPAFDVMDRITGGMAILEADETGLHVYTAGLHQVEYDLPASDMEEYDLIASGACVLKQGDLLDAISSPSFTTTVTIEGRGSDRLFDFNGEEADMWTAASHPNGEIEVDAGSAQAIIDGGRFVEGIQTAARLNGKTEALFAIQDADVWLAFQAVTGEDGETLDELKYDFRGRSVIGEAATTVRMSTVEGVKRSFKRPSRNDVTLNVEDRGRVVLNYNQQANYAAGNGGNVTVSIAQSGNVDGFDLTPPRTPDVPEGVSPIDTSSIEEPPDRVPGVTDAIEGLFDVGQTARNLLFDAENRDVEEDPIIQRLEDWAGALEEVRPDLLSQLVGDPTEEAVDTAEVFIENLETLTDAADDLVSMTEPDPELPETDAIPGFERTFTGDAAPEAADDEAPSDTVPEPAAYTDTAGAWDVALIARPGRPWGERYEAVPLDPGDRRNPSINVTDDVKEQIEDKFRGVPAAQYQDGDVVALAGVGDGVRGGVDVRSFTANPGARLLRDRTTDPDDGSLTITPDDGWVGIHPGDVFKLDDGDLTAGWTTAPARNTDSRNNFHVWWGGRMEKAYHYRDTNQPPYFVYEWDTAEEAPMFQTGTLADDPGQRYHLWARKVPDGDEAIGLVDGTDTGPTPPDPVFRSDYEGDYEINPFIRSQDAASELVGETILARSGGFIREAEVTGEIRDAAGIEVADETIPDGFWAVPASSEHENSTFELVGIPRDDDEEADAADDDGDTEPPDDFGRTIEGTFSDEVIEEGEVEEETTPGGPYTAGTGGKVQVGRRTVDVPAAGEYGELRFYWKNEAGGEGLDGDGSVAAYISDDRSTVLTVEGTRVSNKWGIKAYVHENGVGGSPNLTEVTGQFDGANVDRVTITSGNTADSSAERRIADEWLSPEEANEAVRESGGTDVFSWNREFETDVQTFPIKINVFGQLAAERSEDGRKLPREVLDEVFERVEEQIGDPEQYVSGDVADREEMLVGGADVDVGGVLQGAEPEIVDVDAFEPVDDDGEPVDGDDGGDVEREVEVKVNQRSGGFNTGTLSNRARLSLSPRIADDDPNEVARSIRSAINDEFGIGFARFIGYTDPIAVATVRGGSIEEARGGLEELVAPLELVDVQFQVAANDGPDATINDVRDAFPAFSSPQAADVVEYIGPLADVLQFTPKALMTIDGIGDGTVANIIGSGFRSTVPIGEQGAEIETDDEQPEPPEQEPPQDTRADLPDDSATVGIERDDLEGTGWVHIERDLSDPAEILLLNDDRTIGLFGRRVKLSDQILIEWTGIQYAEPVAEGATPDSGSPSVDSQEFIGSGTDTVDLALDTIRDNPVETVVEAIGDRGGTGEEEVSEALSELASALTDADNLLDAGRGAGVMGTQELQRIQRSIQELERRVDSLENVPMSSDVEDANEAIRRFRNREEEAMRVIEEANEADDGPDELSRGEIETIVENATRGVDVSAIIIDENLQRVRLEPVGDPAVDASTQITAIGGDTRREKVLAAIERWEASAVPEAIDSAELNTARQALNRQFNLSIPNYAPGVSDDEPAPDDEETGAGTGDGEESGVDTEGDIPAQLEELFATELGGLGLPSRPRPPADFVVEEDMARISARPNVPPEWEPVLKEEPGVVTGSLDDPEGFLADYLERLFQAIDFSKVDAAAINQRRGRLNDRFGLSLPLLDEQGQPRSGTEAGDETGGEEAGGEAADRLVEPLRVRGGAYVVPDDVPAGTAEAAREQAEAALGPAEQFDDNTRVGDAIIQDGQVAVRVEEGERILDARRQQEDLEERKPDFDSDAALTADLVSRAFPRLLPAQGQTFAPAFDTLREMIEAPLSELDAIRGVGRGTLERMVDARPIDMDRSISAQRDRPLGIEEDVPDDSPMPEIQTDEEAGEADVPEGVTGGVPETAVSIPPTAPRGEKWIAEQIQRGNRIQPNRFDETPIVELVFPERISEQVRNVASQNDISRGGTGGVMVQNPSFRDELPKEAAALKSIQFLLSQPGDLRSSGFNIQGIINTLSDRLIVVTRSPVVRAPITFPN